MKKVVAILLSTLILIMTCGCAMDDDWVRKSIDKLDYEDILIEYTYTNTSELSRGDIQDIRAVIYNSGDAVIDYHLYDVAFGTKEYELTKSLTHRTCELSYTDLEELQNGFILYNFVDTVIKEELREHTNISYHSSISTCLDGVNLLKEGDYEELPSDYLDFEHLIQMALEPTFTDSYNEIIRALKYKNSTTKTQE